ncbi:MAG: O-antigen ligase family protein [Alphaproteobacteria bacterium]|nr:O-antigen ligase family protein [Alphaproteobacteria bacterium]
MSLLRLNAFHILTPIVLLAPPLALAAGLAMTPLLILAVVLAAQPLYSHRALIHSVRSPLIGLPLCWMLLSALWAVDVADALNLWWRLAFIFLSGAMLAEVSGLKSFTPQHSVERMAVIGIAIACALAAIAGIGHGVLIRPVLAMFGHEFLGHELNRGATVMAVLVWPAALAAWQMNHRKLAYALPVIVLAVLLPLESLSAVVGLSAAIAVAALALGLRERALRWIGVAVLLGILVTPFILYFGIDTVQMSDATERKIPATALHRIYIWEFASHKAAEHPVLGWGLDSSPSIPGHEQEYIPGSGLKLLPLHPHNSILQLWLELGAVGVLLFTGFVGTLLHRATAAPLALQEKTCAVAMLVTYLVVGLTAYGVWQEWWVATGFMAAALMRYLITPAEVAHMQYLARKTL